MKRALFALLLLFGCEDGSTAPLLDDDAATSKPRDARVRADRPRLDGGPPPPDAGVAPDLGRPDSQPRDGAPPDAPLDLPDAADPCPDLDAPLAQWRRPFDTPDTVDGRDPHHSAVEPVINPGDDFVVRGKFAYGTFSRDLEREHVVAYLREGECGPWAEVGREITDNDGRASFAIDRALPVGKHDFVLFVPGDGSRAEGSVWVVEPGDQAVVFDVDGTLTIGDREIFEEVLLGADPEMYQAANDVVQRYAELGYFVVYVTGRPYFLNPSTRAWLAAREFPAGPVRTTDSVLQTRPTEGGVQTFKRDYLSGLIDGPELVFARAYGNADTDICAYAMAGVDPANTWIIGENGGLACEGYDATNPVADYPSHLPLLADLPPAP